MASVLIMGGGLAGLAAATALASRNHRVTLLESRNRLGGRAGSFADANSSQWIDACQHVSMGCCTNYHHFCDTIGVRKYLEPQPVLYFMTPDRRISPFKADQLPAPFHLTRALFQAHYLTVFEKMRISWGLLCMRLTSDREDPPLEPWLLAHGQTPRTIRRFWDVVLTSALNDSVQHLGLRYARKVFVDGFMTHPKGFEVQLPTVPLGRFYGDELDAWFAAHGVQVQLGQAVKTLEAGEGGVTGVLLRDGRRLQADYYLSALFFDRLLGILSAEASQRLPELHPVASLGVSPISSVHLWFDREVVGQPHVVLVDCLGQWIFNRGPQPGGEHYLQVVISASEQAAADGHDELRRRVVAELHSLFPAAREANLIRSRVVTEHKATFRSVPGVDRLRVGQRTSLGNLFLAGDWTLTGWPATMEGAVRSGYLAAEALLKRAGNPCRLLQPDLR